MTKSARYCLLSMVALCAFLSPRAQNQHRGDDRPDWGKLDFRGNWKTDQGDTVVITVAGGILTAKFVSGGDCQDGGKRDFFIQGSLLGVSALRGTMKRCTPNQKLLKECHLSDPNSVKFYATVDSQNIVQNIIHGTYLSDYINYQEKNGHYVDCVTKTGGGGESDFALMRECRNTDEEERQKNSGEITCGPALKCQGPYTICQTQTESDWQKCLYRNEHRKILPTASLEDCMAKQIAANERCKQERDRCVEEIK